MLNFDLTKSALLSGLPYLALSIFLFISGYLADWFQMKGILTTRQVRRYFNCISFILQTVFMLLAAFLVHRVYSVIILTIGVGIGAFSLSGFAVNHLDIAPSYASILWGISNTFGTIPGIISPLLTGFIVTTPVSAVEFVKVCPYLKIFFRPKKNGELYFTLLLDSIYLEVLFIGFGALEIYSLGPRKRQI